MADVIGSGADESVWAGEELLLSTYNVRPFRGWRSLPQGRRADLVFDARLKVSPGYAALKRAADVSPPRRVHVVGVDVPGRDGDLDRVLAGLSSRHHHVTSSRVPMGDRGKFANINLALETVNLEAADWLLVTDDDIAFPPRFLDLFIAACELAQLKIAQPAHRFHSHTTFVITQREWASLVHLTHFVETGPVTAFHRDAFADVLPFPETRWSWGLDIIWSETARERGWRQGVVDATPIEHLRPVAKSYGVEPAREEARALLASCGISRSNREILRTTQVLRRL